MTNKANIVADRFSDSLYLMKNTVDNLVAFSSVDVNTIRVGMDAINGAFSTGAAAYQLAVTKTGSAAAAQAFFAERLFNVPTDISASVVAVNQTYNSLAAAYGALVPAQGVRAFTYDSATKTHSDVDGTAARDSLLPQLQAIQTALAPLTPAS